MTEQEKELSVASHRVLLDMEVPSDYQISLRRFIFLLDKYGIKHDLYRIAGRSKDSVKLFIALNNLDKEEKEKTHQEKVEEYMKSAKSQLKKQGIKI